MEITLNDVEIAIKILTEFLRKQREAQMLLSKFSSMTHSSNYSPLNFEQFVNMAYQQVMAKKKASENETPTEVEQQPTEEDLKRMREIAQKLKNQP